VRPQRSAREFSEFFAVNVANKNAKLHDFITQNGGKREKIKKTRI
jgi:hypothetical protein